MNQERRRYPRVFLLKSIKTNRPIEGAQFICEGQSFLLRDISYTGAALSKPKSWIRDFVKGEQITFHMEFSGEGRFPIEVEVIREINGIVAVQFINPSSEAHIALEKFLHEKLVGLNTRLVDSKYYSAEQDFDFWYHGPNETNIFVWGEPLQKATIEMGYKVLFIENGSIFEGKSNNLLEDPTEDYAYFVNHLAQREKFKDQKLFKSVLSVLSQIPSDNTINGLIKILKNH